MSPVLLTGSEGRRPALLLVTDLAYEARGRRYCDEDIFLASRLREEFDVALCHPGTRPRCWTASRSPSYATAGPSCTTGRRTTRSAHGPWSCGYRSTTRWTGAGTWRARSIWWS